MSLYVTLKYLNKNSNASGGCYGDSGAPLWIKGSEIIAAIYLGRAVGQDAPCGNGWGRAAKLTNDRILSWIRKNANL